MNEWMAVWMGREERKTIISIIYGRDRRRHRQDSKNSYRNMFYNFMVDGTHWAVQNEPIIYIMNQIHIRTRMTHSPGPAQSKNFPKYLMKYLCIVYGKCALWSGMLWWKLRGKWQKLPVTHDDIYDLSSMPIHFSACFPFTIRTTRFSSYNLIFLGIVLWWFSYRWHRFFFFGRHFDDTIFSQKKVYRPT